MSPLTYVWRLCRWFKGHPLAVAAITLCHFVEMGFNAFVPKALVSSWIPWGWKPSLDVPGFNFVRSMARTQCS